MFEYDSDESEEADVAVAESKDEGVPQKRVREADDSDESDDDDQSDQKHETEAVEVVAPKQAALPSPKLPSARSPARATTAPF